MLPCFSELFVFRIIKIAQSLLEKREKYTQEKLKEQSQPTERAAYIAQYRVQI